MHLDLPNSNLSFFQTYGPFTNSSFSFTGTVYVVLWPGVLYLTLRVFWLFRAVSIYMVLDDHHPIVRLIFQKGPNVIQHFIIGYFHFEHLQSLQDTCIYRVRLGSFSTIFCFIGIVDFVHFIWDHFERFSTRKFAVTILPSENAAAPLNLSSALPSSTKLVYLKYYRALSDGLCLDKQNCNRCMVKNPLSLQMLCCCRQA